MRQNIWHPQMGSTPTQDFTNLPILTWRYWYLHNLGIWKKNLWALSYDWKYCSLRQWPHRCYQRFEAREPCYQRSKYTSHMLHLLATHFWYIADYSAQLATSHFDSSVKYTLSYSMGCYTATYPVFLQRIWWQQRFFRILTKGQCSFMTGMVESASDMAVEIWCCAHEHQWYDYASHAGLTIPAPWSR